MTSKYFYFFKCFHAILVLIVCLYPAHSTTSVLANSSSSLLVNTVPNGGENITTTVLPTHTQEDLEKYLRFSVVGSLNQTFEDDYFNKSSAPYRDIIKAIENKILNALGYYDVTHVRINNISPGSVRFRGDLYINGIGEEMLIAFMVRGEDIYNVSVKEICTNHTCSNRGKCFDISKRNTSICSCDVGFRGYRCDVAYPVDGILKKWSAWSSCSTTCNNGTQVRSRHCDPQPINGGRCVISKMELQETRICELKKCKQHPSDDDYLVVALIFGIAFALVLLLLFLLCCLKRKKKTSTQKSSSYDVETFETINAYRVPALVKRPSRASRSFTTNSKQIDHSKSAKQIEVIENDGEDNYGLNVDEKDDFFSEEETIYKKQLDKFLRGAPNITLENDDDEPSVQRQSKPKAYPRVKRAKTPNEKVISRGPENYELVMM